MNIHPTIKHCARSLFFALVAACLALPAHAGSTAMNVTYSPLSHPITSTLPVTDSYVLTVTSPSGLPASSFPITVTLTPSSVSVPLGDALTALSYLHLSTPTLTFTAPNQPQTVNVVVNMPSTALSVNVTAGAYTYKITTLGWPVGVTDQGAGISASVSFSSTSAGKIPTVAINSPADGTSYQLTQGQFPATYTFQVTSTTDANSPVVTAVDVKFGLAGAMNSIPSTSTGLGSAAVTTTGSFTVTAPGTYLLQATATNTIGSGFDTHTYTVTVGAGSPVVAIANPVPGTSYTYRAGDAATPVNVDFSAASNGSVIRSFTVMLDTSDVTSQATFQNLGQANATGHLPLSYTTAGSHTVQVTARDDLGSASATTNFSVTVVAPQPVVTITAPTVNQVFTIPAGASTTSVNYAFTTAVASGFNITAVSASLGSQTLSPVTTGLGTPATSSTGTLTNLAPGTYTLTATGSSGTATDTKSVTFTVRALPTVAITTPVANYTQTIQQGQTANVPLTFVGTSQTPGLVITSLSATCDGLPLSVSSGTLNQVVATGTATIAVTSEGVHHIVVTATDAAGTATTSRDFTVFVLRNITGVVFFDLNGNGVQDGADFGLSFITVKLVNASNQFVALTVTGPDGSYGFGGLADGAYTVQTTAFPGLTATTPTQRAVTINHASVVAAPIGYQLNLCALGDMKAGGYTIGYWKNNISKAIAGRTGGVQVSAAKVYAYTTQLSDFALEPFDGLTPAGAVTVLSSTSSRPADLLAKQLLASEYNYENGAYIGGNPVLTYAFVAWGESVLKNSSAYSSTYLLWVKDWFDAYNNSHGDTVDGPDPLSGSCSGSSGTCSDDSRKKKSYSDDNDCEDDDGRD